MVETYQLRPDEVEILRRCCRLIDRCEAIDRELVDVEMVTIGSKGQTRSHPLLTELRQTEAELGRLLRGLSLPDTDINGLHRRQNRSHAARQMARARWSG